MERSGDLKRELLSFAQGKRFANARSGALEDWFGPIVTGEEHELIGFFDHFLLERRFSDEPIAWARVSGSAAHRLQRAGGRKPGTG